MGAGLPEKGRSYPVIMGNYRDQQAVWTRIDVVPGTALSKPRPLIAKLDPELAETGPSWAPVNSSHIQEQWGSGKQKVDSRKG